MKDIKKILNLKNKLTKILIVIFLVSLLTSCHSEYLNLEIKTDSSIVWNKDSSAFAFVAQKRLYRMPKGIAKFPDGGKSINEYIDFSIYLYNIKNQKLTQLTDLNEYYIPHTYHWLSIKQISLSLNDSALYYKMKYPYDYDLKNIKEEKPEILPKIVKTYKINLKTHKKEVVDTTVYKHLFDKKREQFTNSLSKRYLSDLKCIDWGIDLKKIYPQSKSTYIDYIIKGAGLRECIFNQIVPDFTAEDTLQVVNGMKQRLQYLYEDYDNTDKIKNVYQKSIKKNRYKSYLKYVKTVKKRLNIPFKENVKYDQEYVIKKLKKQGISIPNDFKFKEVVIIGEGYEAEFELENPDTTKIENYKMWFRNQVAMLRKNNWALSQFSIYQKPDANGIIVTNEIDFIWEHTELQQKDKDLTRFIELEIDYGVRGEDQSNFLNFSVTEENNKN